MESTAWILAGLLGPSSPALHLLAVAAQERIRLGAPIFTPDEIADRQRAQDVVQAASGGDEAPDAMPEGIDAVVARLLGVTGS